MSKKRIPDPEGMNEQRSEWAGSALQHFASLTGQSRAGDPDEDIMGDLLADFMHYCDDNDLDFNKILDTARMHYDAETDGQGLQIPEVVDESQ